MKCILVFDHLNDILFSKYNNKFLEHIFKLGKKQGIDLRESQDVDAEINFLIQLFSPIVTSQRVMTSQFGNSYKSMQCQDGTNMVFEEYMGYSFVCLGNDEINWLYRILGVSISIIQHLCGPDVSALKSDNSRCQLVSRLIDTWSCLVSHDQSVLVEAIEQLSIKPYLSEVAIAVLTEATDKIRTQLDYQKSHAIIFLENKFLALYSSKSAAELTASDVLFLSLLVEGTRVKSVDVVNHPVHLFDIHESSEEEEEEIECSQNSCSSNRERKSDVCESKEGIYNDIILLSHNGINAVVPHVVHISKIMEGVSLVLLYQRCSESLSLSLCEAIEAGTAIAESVSTQVETIKRNIERLDSSLKKLFDQLRKIKPTELPQKVDATSKVIHSKWDILKRQWKENGDVYIGGLVVYLKELLHTGLFLDPYLINKQLPQVQPISNSVVAALESFTEFLEIKKLRNDLLAPHASLSINNYLEEYPGLIHFMYIDRTNHRITAPALDCECMKTVEMTRRKIWSMVEFGRDHLQEGYTSLIWKDFTFNYSYFLWFEDNAGSPLKPKISPTVVVRSLPIPGVFSGNFYEKLVSGCFPKMEGKVRCIELMTVHLDLVTSPLTLDHCRRLAATIWEVTGTPRNPLDFF